MTVLLFILLALALTLIAGAIVWLAVTSAYEEEPWADEVHHVTTEDGWTIRLCRYCATQGGGEPVLLVHGLGGNQYTFAYPEGDSLTDSLVRQGYDCWAIDLRGCRSSQAPAGVSRYTGDFDGMLMHDLPAAIKYIQAKTKNPQLHWIGHSLGGMLLYAYELTHGRESVASGTTLGTPPGFRGIRITGTNVYSGIPHFFLRFFPAASECVFRLAMPLIPIFRPRSRHFPIVWENMHESTASGSFFNGIELLNRRVWEDASDWSQRNEWRVSNGEIDVMSGMTTLETPLLSMYGSMDAFVPVQNAETFFEGLPSDDKALLILSKANGYSADYGHIDIAFARKGHEEVHVPILQWLDTHSLDGEKKGNVLAFAKPGTPADDGGNEASWQKALKRAAVVMDDLSDEPLPKVTLVKSKPIRKKAAAKLVAKKPAAKPKKASAKKKAPKKKAAPKKVTAKKKPAAKKKTTVKKKAATIAPKKKKAAAKKPATKAKPKPATKKKAAAKKKSGSK